MVIINGAMGLNHLINGGAGNPYTILQGNPKLEEYSNFLNFTIDRAFNICGYNSPQGTREHGTNKTRSEVSINMQNDLLTTNEKRWIQTNQINRLIKMLGRFGGYKDIDCKLVIHGMTTIEMSKLTDTTILQVQSGLLDRKTNLLLWN